MPNEKEDTRMSEEPDESATETGPNDAAEPESLVDFFRRSPLAKAIADGELSADAFERERELPRDIDLSDLGPGKLSDATP
jgi:hypothetical protein